MGRVGEERVCRVVKIATLGDEIQKFATRNREENS